MIDVEKKEAKEAEALKKQSKKDRKTCCSKCGCDPCRC